MKKRHKPKRGIHVLLSIRSALISFLAAAALFVYLRFCTYPIGDMRYSCIAKITGTEMNKYFLGANILKWVIIVLLIYFALGITWNAVSFAIRRFKNNHLK